MLLVEAYQVIICKNGHITEATLFTHIKMTFKAEQLQSKNNPNNDFTFQ